MRRFWKNRIKASIKQISISINRIEIRIWKHRKGIWKDFQISQVFSEQSAAVIKLVTLVLWLYIIRVAFQSHYNVARGFV